MTKVKAISLLSGGLDSLLAARVVQDQGVEVLALHFISPFFGSALRGKEREAEELYLENFGIKARVVDVSEEYLGVVGEPRYGYGKNFNPCIDCKIFLFKKALEVMRQEGAKFLITGEVLGQRPMSQRRDTLNIIARDMGEGDILLRPLCAKLLKPTRAEEEGWVDREKLYGFSGRSRKPQMALAEELGIAGYPSPAGGCSLTDPIQAKRMSKYFEATPAERRSPGDIRLLLAGRPFRFPGGSILTLGRNEGENKFLMSLKGEGDEFVRVLGAPGPLGVFRAADGADERELAASALLRYCPKAADVAQVAFADTPDKEGVVVEVSRPSEEELEGWRA
ncbi:MAG: thiamine biosynthesis protein [Deltaproteobacteria bacterium]|nr:MAG: thiamine biosynthesis protein [Deltaproteobacteria bacterium]